MRSALQILSLPVLLAGCPDPDTVLPGPGSDPAVPPPSAAPGGGPGAAPADAGAAPAPTAGGPGPFTPPPGLDALVGAGPSVTITGTVDCGDAPQLDVLKLEGETSARTPVLLEIRTVTGGRFSLRAPATYESELYLVATDRKGEQPAPTDPMGHHGPFRLEGKDVTATIVCSADGSTKLPWYGEKPSLPAGTGSDGAAAEGAPSATNGAALPTGAGTGAAGTGAAAAGGTPPAAPAVGAPATGAAAAAAPSVPAGASGQ